MPAYNTEQERDSPFLFVVFGFPLPLRLCLLFLSQALPDGVCFRFLMEQICNISLAVKHHQRIVFLAVGVLHTSNRRAFFSPRMESRASISSPASNSEACSFNPLYSFSAASSSAEYFASCASSFSVHFPLRQYPSLQKKYRYHRRSPENGAAFLSRFSVPPILQSALRYGGKGHAAWVSDKTAFLFLRKQIFTFLAFRLDLLHQARISL